MKTRVFLTLIVILTGLLPLAAQNTLWINDPTYTWNWQNGKITDASLSVHPKGLYVEYGLYLTFSGSTTNFAQNSNLEVVLDFELPKGAIVLDSWLWVGEDIVQGKLIDRWSASQIYEGIVNRRRDPSVLFKNSDTQYELRVYPMKRSETRKVKITYLMPATWSKGKVETAIPSALLSTSNEVPDLYVFIWEDKGFVSPAFINADIPMESRADQEFGQYKWAKVPAAKLQSNPAISFDAPMQNGVYFSVFEDKSTSYYQMALSPASFIAENKHNQILVLVDYEAGNSSFTKDTLIATLKQRLLASYNSDDSFNLIYSKLQVQQTFTSWKPVTAENIDAAMNPLITESLYSNLPGIFSTAFDFLKATGGQGSIILLTNSDNFGNYEQSNNLIRDLKNMQNPLPPINIADFQDNAYTSYYIGNRYYYGQEYLYVNLSKASAGDYKNIRDQTSLSTLIAKVISSTEGMITAFDLYTAPADGFCYGRFGTNIFEGFPVNQTVTQIGKYLGQSPFLISLTGLYQSQPFSQLLQVGTDQINPADTMLGKMWHGRYIAELETSDRNNMIDQEILFESMNNRVLSIHSAFLCLEPSDTVSACQTCKDESRLVGRTDQVPVDSAGFVKMYPNPFRDRLTMEISLEQLSSADQVVIKIFNLSGQLVFEKKEETTGRLTVTAVWNGATVNGDQVPAGQYIVMIRAGDYIMSKQIVKSE
jgi:Ca-activated chloride channel family protein